MFEVLLIMCLVNACTYMPLRGKTLEGLSYPQQVRFGRIYNSYMYSLAGRRKPMLPDDFLKKLQEKGLNSLIGFFCLLPIYVLAAILIISSMF